MAYCGDCIHLDVCKTADSCDGHVPRCKHFMDKKTAVQITKCAKCKDSCGTLFDALESIVHYDGHYEWLKKMRDDMETHKGEGNYFLEFEEWHTEEHTIWMLLVGMFGEWGTSIRSGWIEKEKIEECIEFIDSVCELAMQAAERNGELEEDDG